MSALWTIEEDGVDVICLASPSDIYYLLENDAMLVPQSTIGYCKSCSSYTWIENLSPPEDDFLTEKDAHMREWYARLRAYFKSRTAPPTCLHCSGTEIVYLHQYSDEGVLNPATGKLFRIRLGGTGYVPGLRTIFLDREGTRLNLPEDLAKSLVQRVKGYFYA